MESKLDALADYTFYGLLIILCVLISPVVLPVAALGWAAKKCGLVEG